MPSDKEWAALFEESYYKVTAAEKNAADSTLVITNEPGKLLMPKGDAVALGIEYMIAEGQVKASFTNSSDVWRVTPND